MGILNTIIDVGLAVANVASIRENHTEARTKQERKEQWERRRTISDLRNAAFLVKRFI